jgi:hypothetical protein
LLIAASFLLLMLDCGRLWAGPPFQTDDPEPVDLHHYELYQFGSVSSTPVETDPTGPALEFNWGAVPNVQLHVILPFGAIFPPNNPIYRPAGTGPSAFGLTDMELGVKYRFVKETKHRPQIETFTMVEVPIGSIAKGSVLEKFGASFRYGFRRAGANGQLMAVTDIKWFRKTNIETSPSRDGSFKGMSAKS